MRCTIFGKQDYCLTPGNIYCWTNSIRGGRGILLNTRNREIIVNSLRRLVWEEKLKVYAFVIMPNHIHLVWELLASANKDIIERFRDETTELIMGNLNARCPDIARSFRSGIGMKYRIWRKRPKLMTLHTKQQIGNVLSYVHSNPAFDRWRMVQSSEDFEWSSAKFYTSGIDPFGFLSHYSVSEDQLSGYSKTTIARSR